ncbi:hypothetical protein LCGC14_2022430, partial [marine sediment metagenome]
YRRNPRFPRFKPDANTALWFPGQDDAQSSTIRDRSGNGNDGTLANTTWVQNSKGLWVLDFNGTTSIGTVSDAASIQNIFDGGGTIEAWVNLRNDGENDLGFILDKSANFIKSWTLRVASELAGQVQLVFLCVFDGTGGRWTTPRIVNLDNYCYVAVIYNADATTNNPTVIVDDSIFTVGSGLEEPAAPVGTRVSDAGVDLTIGNVADGSRTTDGAIGLVRASDISRTTGVLQGTYRQERGLFGV